MTERISLANDLWNNGYNCSQSVVGAFCEKFGVDIETASRFAAGFGGGLRCGEVCGVVTGAVMVIGLKYGQNYLVSNEECKEITLKFMEEFKKRNNTYTCREILGYDPRDKEMAKNFASKKGTVCANAIELAIKILEEMGI
jgi:C_GCAxxG_C_C family probable redox protein